MSSRYPIDISPGDVIDDFEIVDVIAAGSSSTTFRATHLTLAREVALKFVYPVAFSGDRDAIDAARADATRVARLEHPAVAPVFAAGPYEGGFYIVSAITKGRTLADLGAEGSLTPSATARVLTDIAAALEAAHAQHVVHRDLRPDCITVDRWGHGVLSDFGITRTSGRTGHLTRVEILESLRYTAPEVVLGRPASSAADVYGLAAVAVWCLTGAAPYRDRATGEYVQFRTTAPAPVLKEPDGATARQVNIALAEAMAIEPDARPAATAFAAALSAAVEGMKPALRDAGTPLVGWQPGEDERAAMLPIAGDATRVEHRRPLPQAAGEADEKRPWGMYAVCAMVAVIVGLGGLFAGRSQRPQAPQPARIGAFALDPGDSWKRARGSNGARARFTGAAGETATVAIVDDRRLPGDPVPSALLPDGAGPPRLSRSGGVGLVRYAGPRTLLVARPTTKGTLFAACSTTTPPGRCAALVVHAQGPGRNVAVIPSKPLSDVLAQAMKGIGQEIGLQFPALKRRSTQAGAAQAIAARLDTVAPTLQVDGADPGTAAELERLRAALIEQRDAFTAISAAVDQRSDVAINAGRERARKAYANLTRSLAAFKRAGYDVES